MADDPDLVSQVRIEGTQQAEAQLDSLAAKGEQAFSRLDQSARKAGAGVNAAGDQIATGASRGAQGLNQLQNSGQELPSIADRLGRVEQAASKFAASLPRLSLAIGRFTQRLTLVGTAAAAAGVALANSARNSAKSVDGQSDSLEKLTNSQIDANNSQLQGQIAGINYAASQRKLQQELSAGKLTYAQYGQALVQLNKDFEEQQRVAAEVENAQRRVKEENERLQKTLADRKAYQQLIDTFGGPLTSSLVAFGRQVEGVRQGFLGAFGPGLASLVDKIGAVLAKNGAAIEKFFSEASKKLEDLITKEGPAIQALLENIGAAAAAIFNGLIAAAPALIDFFNNQLVPAIQSFLAGLQSVADVINSVFGTKITAGFLVVILLLGTLTGAFRLLFSVIRTGILGLQLIGAVAAALNVPFLVLAAAIAAVIAIIYGLTQIDWAAVKANAGAALQGLITFFNNVGAAAIAVKDAIVAGWNSLVSFFTTLAAGIGAVLIAFWTTVTQPAVTAVNLIIDAWNGLLAFFQSLQPQLQALWDQVSQAIVTAFQSAVQQVTAFFSSLYQSALQYLQPIIDLVNKVKDALGFSGGGSASTAGNTPGFAGGGKVNGRGTGTSDSILARLSNGEFVMKAAAVKQYGVSFMNRINQGMMNFRGFASGGFAGVGRPPSVSAGQNLAHPSSSGMRPLDLTIFGETFEGLMMPDDVATRMTKFAIAKGNKSGGRKPAWVGRGRNNA